MGKLTTYLQAEQLPLGALLAEVGQRLVEVDDEVTHVDLPDFRGRVVSRTNGRCKVKVLDGWRGPMPTWAVGMPAGKLEVVG